MMDPYIGEIRQFAGNYAPHGWAFCNGQVLSITQNEALFPLIGTTYGGDGHTNFALPDLRGRAAMHQGHGRGLTPRIVGEAGGLNSVTLTETEMPSHTHVPNCRNNKSDFKEKSPEGAVWMSSIGRGAPAIYAAYSTTNEVNMNPQCVQPAGGNQPHNNMQPFLGLNFIICLYGEYPIRQY